MAEQVQALLTDSGARVALSRPADTGAGPCVDQRAALGNQAAADVVVSIHADGAAPDGHGFHINYAAPPLPPAQSGPSVQLADQMRDAMVAGGFLPATCIGSGGLMARADRRRAEPVYLARRVGRMRQHAQP